MTDFSKYVHALGRGPSKGRNLTRDEASDAMALILSGDAAPEAVGALLMLMRYRGETAAEIAGFVDALRDRSLAWSQLDVAVDWPSYAAGRSRGHPWFLLSAKLVAAAGYPVMLHGWNSHQNPMADVATACAALGISTCDTVGSAQIGLKSKSIIYCPLSALSPRALTLMKLRDVLGLRSAVNTALRAYNPSRADLSLQGVFHPGYRDLQADAAMLLGQKSLLVVKGGGGEFERNPSKETKVFSLTDERRGESSAPAVLPNAMRLSDASRDVGELTGLWSGTVQNEFATQIVVGTAALALSAYEINHSLVRAQAKAEMLWNDRDQHPRTG